MKTTIPKPKQLLVAGVALALLAFTPPSRALDSLTNGVAAYWPMDIINGGVLTPDLGPNSFDLKPYNSKNVVAFNGANIVPAIGAGPHANINGRQNGTNALTTVASQSTILGYIAPVTTASQLTNLLVPPLNQANWTLSFWLKAAQSAANTGNRMFAIAESPLGNGPNLLWDFTQSNAGDPSQFGHFRRQAASIINGIPFLDDNGSGDQINTISAGSPVPNIFDNNWHNVTLVAQTVTNIAGPVIDSTQFGNPNSGSVTVVWNSVSLDSLTNNAPFQVDTNQVYMVQVASNLLGPWTTLATVGSSGNGVTQQYTDNAPSAGNAFYRVSKPRIRLQTKFLYVDGQTVPITQGDSIDALLPTGAWQSWPSKTGARYRQMGYFFCDTMMFGGYLRAAGEGGYVNASYSDAAVWSRALKTNEIAAYIRDGITNASVFQPPLVSAIIAEFPAVTQGDTDLISWSASKPPATLALNPGNTDVTPISNFGIGSSNSVVSSNTVFSLVATRSGVSVTGSVPVICVSNVTSNWRYVDSFTYLNDGPIAGQGGWLNPPRGPANPSGLQNLNVYTSGAGNNYVGFDGNDNNNGGNGAIAGRNLLSFKNTPGDTNSIFFRFYIPPASTNLDPTLNYILPIQMNVGISDLGILDPAINGGNGAGPQITITQPSSGGAIDLTASSGASGITVSPGGYDYLTDPNTGSTNGLVAGHVYNVWIDVINNFPGAAGVVGGYASGGEQTNAAIYAVWLQRDDWAARTNLFASITCTNTYGGIMNGTVYAPGYLLSPRDYSANNQNNTLLGPSANMQYLFLRQVNITGDVQATNSVVFDDFYISKKGTGFNTTAPVTAGTFTP